MKCNIEVIGHNRATVMGKLEEIFDVKSYNGHSGRHSMAIVLNFNL